MAKRDKTSAAPRRPEELQAPGYEIFIGLLAVISLVNLALTILPGVPTDFKQIAVIVDVPITLIFLADFAMRLRHSHPRRTYFIDQRGWLDLLGSLPSVFRLLRLFRLARVMRLLREYGLRNVFRSFIEHRADNALLVVALLVLVVLEFGSMIVLGFEANAPGANITTGGDALWWAFVSITTVGYGDKYPITPGGRTSAVFVLAAGVGLFGVLSGYLANFFLSPAKTDDEPATSTADAAPGAAGTTPVLSGGPPQPSEADAQPIAAAVRQPTPPVPGPPQRPGARVDVLAALDDLEARIAALRESLAEPADPT